MVEDGSLDVLRILSTASAVIAEGEVLQLSTANNLGTTEEQYFRVIRAKTAELFAAACEVGAVVAERTPAECQAMRDYGMYLGIAFQISDDVLDYAAAEKRLGKTVGDDFREGKMTLPVIQAIARASVAERNFWTRCLADPAQKDGDLQEALAILKKHNTLETSLSEARKYAGLGIKALESLPNHPLRQHLTDLIVFAVERDY
jgi:octaprenyl-diphosphate synthase